MKNTNLSHDGTSNTDGTQTIVSDLRSPLKDICLYRLPQVLARVPVSRSSWFAGIQLGRYPRGLQLGLRTTVWRSDDIERLIQSLEVVS